MKQPSSSVKKLYVYHLTLLILTLATYACVQINFSTGVAIPTPLPTPLIWPTLSPRPTPLIIAVVTPVPPCPIPDLPEGQHISASGSYTETESTAAGRMLCHIKRGSCAYNYLVGKLDPTITFKREETPPYDTEDILMHPAIIQPLSRLNELVLIEWSQTVQLRITDAYDSLLEHDPSDTKPAHRYSLHYEGRAVDLTTWPVDQRRYGRLCALAHCAGFDWVENEGSHCHASIKANSLCIQCTR
jgi:hypothetical protein